MIDPHWVFENHEEAAQLIESLQQEHDALAAHVEQLHMAWVDAKRCVSVVAFPSLYLAEQYQSLAKRSIEKLESVVADTPATSLARVRGEVRRQVAEEWELGLPRIKAEWQAEVIWQFITEIEEAGWETAPALVVSALYSRHAELSRLAKEEGL